MKRYEKPLFNYIRRIVGSAADAEDLFQETFLRVYKHLDGFRTTGLFRPWLYRIAGNQFQTILTSPLQVKGYGFDIHHIGIEF